MNRVNPFDTGLTLGIFFGLFHAVWSLMILFGAAQRFLDFIFGLHMITPPYTVSGFSWLNAIGLIIIAAAIGYIFGWAFGIIWNRYAVR